MQPTPRIPSIERIAFFEPCEISKFRSSQLSKCWVVIPVGSIAAGLWNINGYRMNGQFVAGLTQNDLECDSVLHRVG